MWLKRKVARTNERMVLARVWDGSPKRTEAARRGFYAFLSRTHSGLAVPLSNEWTLRATTALSPLLATPLLSPKPSIDDLQSSTSHQSCTSRRSSRPLEPFVQSASETACFPLHPPETSTSVERRQLKRSDLRAETFITHRLYESHCEARREGNKL